MQYSRGSDANEILPAFVKRSTFGAKRAYKQASKNLTLKTGQAGPVPWSPHQASLPLGENTPKKLPLCSPLRQTAVEDGVTFRQFGKWSSAGGNMRKKRFRRYAEQHRWRNKNNIVVSAGKVTLLSRFFNANYLSKDIYPGYYML